MNFIFYFRDLEGKNKFMDLGEKQKQTNKQRNPRMMSKSAKNVHPLIVSWFQANF